MQEYLRPDLRSRSSGRDGIRAGRKPPESPANALRSGRRQRPVFAAIAFRGQTQNEPKYPRAFGSGGAQTGVDGLELRMSGPVDRQRKGHRR